MHRSIIALALSSWLVACLPASQPGPGGSTPTGVRSRTQSKLPAPGERRRNAPTTKPAKVGWSTVDDATAGRIDALARRYAAFLGRAKTARAAVSALVSEFVDAGGVALMSAERNASSRAPAPGARLYFRGTDGHTAMFIKLGRQPLERGVRMIIAALDAPHIQLKQRPIVNRAGLAMFDTIVHGQPDLRLWLSRPLALHLHLARPGSADGGLDVSIGERPDEPVLVIPDLLPHLSGKVQRRRVVDSAERMDAVAARSYRALIDFLAGQGVDRQALATAESALVPAGRPAFIGADRALLAGHGHSHRALAYAAVRALADGSGDADQTIPQRTAVVIVVRSTSTSAGTSGLGFVPIALSRLLSAVSTKQAGPDILDTRRMYAQSTAWISSAIDELAPGRGIGLSPRTADAVPRATRRIIDSLETGGAPYQLVGARRGWDGGRVLGALDMDAIGVAIPTRHRDAPAELLSTLDLHYALQAARAWLISS